MTHYTALDNKNSNVLKPKQKSQILTPIDRSGEMGSWSHSGRGSLVSIPTCREPKHIRRIDLGWIRPRTWQLSRFWCGRRCHGERQCRQEEICGPENNNNVVTIAYNYY